MVRQNDCSDVGTLPLINKLLNVGHENHVVNIEKAMDLFPAPLFDTFQKARIGFIFGPAEADEAACTTHQERKYASSSLPLRWLDYLMEHASKRLLMSVLLPLGSCRCSGIHPRRG